MSCINCDKAQLLDENELELVSYTYIRVENANILVSGCDEHLKQLFTKMNNQSTDETNEEIKEPILLRLREIIDNAQVVSHYDEAINEALDKMQPIIVEIYNEAYKKGYIDSGIKNLTLEGDK